MDIEFVVFNRKKKKKYQLETAIGQMNGARVVRKRALHETANDHIAQIHHNYSMLQEHYANISNVKLASTWMENQNLYTEYLTSPSLYELAINCAVNKDIKGVYRIITDYISFINSLHVTNVHNAETSDQYRKIFGQKLKYLSGNVFQYSNIDLIFENIFYDDRNYYVIDLEWVLPFQVPIKYIMFRALHQLYENLSNYVSISSAEIMQYAGIDEQEQQLYMSMERNFNEWVMAREYLSNYRKKELQFSFAQVLHDHQNEMHTNYIQQTYMKQSILLHAQGKPIGIWGTGSAALKTLSILKEQGFEVSGFIDNNAVKWGTVLEQRPVFSPEQALSMYIIIGSSYFIEIQEQLNAMGSSEEKDYCFGIVK